MVSMQPVLPDFEHIKRYHDVRRDIVVAKILPGEFYVTKQDEAISTVLGSCISVCIRDVKLGIGGMNHFMLPVKGDLVGHLGWQNNNSYTCRYGLWAMEYLINEILKYGGAKKDFEVKLFGGGRVLHSMASDVGAQNIQFAKDYISNEGLVTAGCDVGGPWPRKVLFFPATGKVLVKKLQTCHNDTIQRREIQYQQSLEKPIIDKNDVELF